MKRLGLLAGVLLTSVASVGGWKEKVAPDVRRPAIGCVKAGELRLKSTYASVSVVYGAETELPGFALEYRVNDGEWKKGAAPFWFGYDRNYRGSLLELPEDSTVGVRLLSDGKVVASGECRTWKTDVPIAKTVEIDAAKVGSWPYTIDGVGTEDGWIRYTVKGVVDQRKGWKSFCIAGATNVILEGAVMRGANGIVVTKGSKGVRIRNCDISGWGDPGKVRFDVGGGLWTGDTFDPKRGTWGGHNHTGAIDVEPGVSDVTVERCVVREPASRANSWRYSHPYGPAAIRLNHPDGGVVLRWNALFSCERHRFDDAVKGIDNSSLTGGFNRDADVYGNFMFCCNDDNIEFDGGGQNVRAWGNRFEESAMGISLQMISASPCYVFKNVFSGLGMEHDEGYAQIKLNSFDVWNYGSQARVWKNRFHPGYLTSSFKGIDTNRVVYTDNPMTDEVPPLVPFQPVDWHLDAARLDFTLAAGALAPSAKAAVTLTVPGKTTKRFSVVKCDSDDWFAVTPASGVRTPGRKRVFTVTLDAAKLAGRRKWAGAFVVRDEDGFFRPVTLHVRTDHVEALRRRTGSGVRACYEIPEKPLVLRQGNKEKAQKLTIKVPQKGRYYLLAYVRGKGDFNCGFDGAKLQRSNANVYRHWTWTPLGRKGRYNMPPLDLEAGDHALVVRGGFGTGDSEVELGGVVLTDDPQAFEPDDRYGSPDFGDVDIRDCGARPDGTKCTAAFSQAMERCAKTGGGRVVVPKGRWMTGAIRFRSNCELHLSEGSEVLFSQDPDDYLPAVQTSWEGMECWNYCPLVYACCCTNVAISGTGTLRAYEGEWKDTKWYPWVWQENGIRAARRQLYDWGATDYPVEKRQIWKMKNANTRPHFVQFNRCGGVRLEDFRIRNSPFWTVHLYMCDDVLVRGLDVRAHGNNNDGIDIEMCRNVLVEGCTFDQGDDGVVIKSGRNRDAWRLNRPCENVLIRNCRVVNAHTILGIGSEISGGVRNVRMADCTGDAVDRVVYLKTNHRRGGFIEKVLVENVMCKEARKSIFEIGTDVLYEWAKFPDYETALTRISDIAVSNVTCRKTARLVKIAGDARKPVENVRVQGLRAEEITAKAVDVENVKNFSR